MKLGSSSSKFALLGVLSLKPSSGYDIKQFVKGSIGHFWNESYGRIYPLLKELAKEGLIVRQRAAKTSGRPERLVYSITSKGEAALRQWLKESPRNEPARSELLLKLFFADRIQPELTAQHVLEKKKLEQTKLAIYRQAEESIREHYPTHPGLPYWLMTISFGRHMAEGLVAWCDETLQTLSELNRKAKKKRGTA